MRNKDHPCLSCQNCKKPARIFKDGRVLCKKCAKIAGVYPKEKGKVSI